MAEDPEELDEVEQVVNSDANQEEQRNPPCVIVVPLEVKAVREVPGRAADVDAVESLLDSVSVEADDQHDARENEELHEEGEAEKGAPLLFVRVIMLLFGKSLEYKSEEDAEYDRAAFDGALRHPLTEPVISIPEAVVGVLAVPSHIREVEVVD